MSDGLKMKYFVLNPTGSDAYGSASRYAIRAYADAIINENPELCIDLKHWMEKLERALPLEEDNE